MDDGQVFVRPVVVEESLRFMDMIIRVFGGSRTIGEDYKKVQRLSCPVDQHPRWVDWANVYYGDM